MRDAAVQTYVLESEYISPKVSASQPTSVQKKHPSWFHRPHTVTVLCTSLFLIWIFSNFHGKLRGLRHNIISGIIASVFLFLVFCILQFPDGILVRPARGCWRFVKGVSVLYLSLLVFLLFQDLRDIRYALKLIDGNLNGYFLDKSYAEDCRILTLDHHHPFANIMGKLDVFVPAHLFGWMIKSLVIRDVKLLWFLSILFEWMEVSLRHILPNFYECWWDHLILDIFGCNLLGIYFGLKICKHFKFKKYEWRVGREEQERTNVCLSTLARFTPYKWTEYHWPAFLLNHETFIALLVFTFSVTLIDLNFFFLKAELLLPPSHWINICRICFWAIASASGTREFYEYMTDINSRRMGVQCWLDFAIVLSELLLIIRWSDGLDYSRGCPYWITVTWVIIGIIVCCLLFKLLFLQGKHKRS